jgi:hypothetical protein
MTEPSQNSSGKSPVISSPSATTGYIESPTASKTWGCSRCSQSQYLQNLRGTALDPRSDLSRPVHGWPELVNLIQNYCDSEAFPSFRDLNIKSLLYYQCELAALREELHALEWDDHLQGESQQASKFNTRVDSLLSSKDNEDERTHQQIDLINKIREILDKYSTSQARNLN